MNADKTPAPIGRIGCDPPKVAVDMMLQTFAKRFSDVDFITYNGDMIAHGVSEKTNNQDHPHYDELMAVHIEVQQMLTKYFPNKPILITFGNNDCPHHNSAPFQFEKQQFYNDMWKIWFQNHPGNAKFATANVQKTFMYGGYFRVDVTSSLSVLSLNTLEYNVDQYPSEVGPEHDALLQWLEAQLSEQSSRKFIILSHIYAGSRTKHSTVQEGNELWNDDDTDKYFKIIHAHSDRIAIEIGGHDHWAGVRTYENKCGETYRNILIPAGIAPNQGNMPGVQSLEIGADGVPRHLQLISMDITSAYGKTSVPSIDQVPFYQLNFDNFGFTDLSAAALDKELKDFETKPWAEQEAFLVDKIGYDASHSDLKA